MSLAVTPGGRRPSTSTSMFLDFVWISVWVASTCSTSEVPIPYASAPNAPCVAVWLSPHTIVVPGSVKPCSGPMMCTMPWRRSNSSKYSMPKSLAFFASVLICSALSGSGLGSCDPSSARCDRPRQAFFRARAPCGRTCAIPRTPAGSSPRARDGDRCRAGRFRPGLRRPDGRPRSCRRGYAWASVTSNQDGSAITNLADHI